MRVQAPPAEPMAPATAPARVVIDTNVALDLLVFGDVAAQPLAQALAAGHLHWLATAAMHDELERVLGYPQIARSLAFHERLPAAVLADFRQQSRSVDVAPRASYACKDPDDQKFIDLAVAHRAALISKDRAVLSMARRLSTLGVATTRSWMPPC